MEIYVSPGATQHEAITNVVAKALREIKFLSEYPCQANLHLTVAQLGTQTIAILGTTLIMTTVPNNEK